jgi:hypothetical protein
MPGSSGATIARSEVMQRQQAAAAMLLCVAQQAYVTTMLLAGVALFRAMSISSRSWLPRVYRCDKVEYAGLFWWVFGGSVV